MTPVKQEKPTECFRACLASMLDMLIQTVPDFYAGQQPGTPIHPAAYRAMQKWLAGEGLVLLPIIVPIADPTRFASHMRSLYPDLHYIQIGESRKGRVHAVVGRNGRIVHDPAPVEQGGLLPVNNFYHVCLIGKLV